MILHDWSGYLADKYEGTLENHWGGKVNLKVIKENFQKMSYEVEIKEFVDIDLSQDYNGWYVLYASSEERGLFYKEFIEDIVLALKLNGAILIPEFKFFRAHHNKVFAELLRSNFKDDILKQPVSRSIGKLSELSRINNIEFPCVVKTSSGAGSQGVRLVHDWQELYKVAKKLMSHVYRNYEYTIIRDIRSSRIARNIKLPIKYLFGQLNAGYLPVYPTMSNKIIIQQYIPDLKGDYKVLYYSGKYYVLNRKNRDGDFRASGSGKFEFPESVEAISSILNFAKRVVEEITMPMISMDLAQNQYGCYLLEYQCISFGPYTIQYSKWYFSYEDSKWIRVNKESIIEEEYCRSIAEHINRLNENK